VRLMETPSVDELAGVTGLAPSGILIRNSNGEDVESDNDDSTHAPGAIYISARQDQLVDVLQRVMARYRIVDMGIEEQSLEKVIQRLFEERT